MNIFFKRGKILQTIQIFSFRLEIITIHLKFKIQDKLIIKIKNFKILKDLLKINFYINNNKINK
jgi:hypothetical protein